MPKFPKDVIQRAYDVGFSDEELHEAEENTAIEAFIERIAAREKVIENATAAGEVQPQDNIIETDMTGGKIKLSEAVRMDPPPVLGGVDASTLQRFEALCLLKGWDSGEKLTEILEDRLTSEGFKREDKVD